MFIKPTKLTKMITLSARNLYAFGEMHPLLAEIVSVGFDHTPSNELYITSLDRTISEDRALGASGIHSDMYTMDGWRALDQSWPGITQEAIDEVCSEVNALYQYDPDRPHLKVAYGAPHGTGLHIHYQIHPNTIRIRADG